MSHKGAVHAVDKLLMDLKINKNKMGGITILFSGDYRQILPVIPNGTKADEINACLKNSNIWNSVINLTLKKNMRLSFTEDNQIFAWNLLRIGEGKINLINESEIKLPIGIIVETRDELIKYVFNDFDKNCNDIDWLSDRSILAPTNEVVDSINQDLLKKYLQVKV